MSEAGSVPSPMTSFSMRTLMASTKGSATSPTAATTEMAMHRSPADP